VISPGFFQLETGLAFTESGPSEAFSIGQLFLRYGISERVELEILANSFVLQRTGVGAGRIEEEGFEDMGVGAKAKLVESERATFSLQGFLTGSTGSEGFTSDAWYVTANGLLDVGLTERAGLGVNLGFRPGMGGLDPLVTANVTPGLSLGGGFGVYGGWAGAFTSGSDVNYLEAGGSALVGADVQLDVNGAWSVDEDTWFVGVGFSTRWGAGG
jgi:hypothetical protein